MNNNTNSHYPFDRSIEKEIFDWLLSRELEGQTCSITSLLLFAIRLPDNRIDAALTILNVDRETISCRLEKIDSRDETEKTERMARINQLGAAISNACSYLNHDRVDATTILWATLISDIDLAFKLGVRIDRPELISELASLFGRQ